jgi:hypothetical protein
LPVKRSYDIVADSRAQGDARAASEESSLTEPKKPGTSNLDDLKAMLVPPRGASSPVVPPPAGGVIPSPLPPPTFTAAPLPPPILGPAAGIAPPPFMQQQQPQKPVEEDPEERRRKLFEAAPVIVDDSAPETRKGSAASAGIFLLVLGTVVVCTGIGWAMGGQIFRTVRASRAISSALTLYTQVSAEQETLRGLKSRVSGAARKAVNPTEPSADFELLGYLSKVAKERPFTAKVWSHEYYPYFKASPLLFQYHDAAMQLWDLIDSMNTRYNDPVVTAKLKAWPAKRDEVLKQFAPDETSGYAVFFRSEGGKVLGALGSFGGAQKVTEGGSQLTKAEIRPLGGGEPRSLFEYPPGNAAALSDNPGNWFIRLNPATIVGPQRLIVQYPGPLIARESDDYRQYLADLNQLSLGLQSTTSAQDKLLGALGEIKQAPRPFTFGF